MPPKPLSSDPSMDELYEAQKRLHASLNELSETVEKALKARFESSSLYNWFQLKQDFEFVNPIFTRTGDFVLEVYKTSKGIGISWATLACVSDANITIRCPARSGN